MIRNNEFSTSFCRRVQFSHSIQFNSIHSMFQIYRFPRPPFRIDSAVPTLTVFRDVTRLVPRNPWIDTHLYVSIRLSRNVFRLRLSPSTCRTCDSDRTLTSSKVDWPGIRAALEILTVDCRPQLIGRGAVIQHCWNHRLKSIGQRRDHVMRVPLSRQQTNGNDG